VSLIYVVGAMITGLLAAGIVRALRRAIRGARVARELEQIHRDAYRERAGARGRG